jgi:hypothetical protein
MQSGTQNSALGKAGQHRLIVALYAILTLAALGRSSFQLLTKFEEAPLWPGCRGLSGGHGLARVGFSPPVCSPSAVVAEL